MMEEAAANHVRLQDLEEAAVNDERLGQGSKLRPKFFQALFYGQVLAFIVALSALFTKIIVERHNVSSPALQMTTGYACVVIFAIMGLACEFRKGERPALFKTNILGLFLISIADSQAGFLGNLAYRFGVSIASVGMLSSFTIPCAMLLSYCFLKVRYRYKHFIGTGIALLGLMFVILADAMGVTSPIDGKGAGTNGTDSSSEDDNGLSNVLLADFLILIGSAFYAISNVATEAFVKSGSINIYLFWLGTFGSIISLIQFVAFEGKGAVRGVRDVTAIVFLLIGYSVAFSGIYLGSSRYLAAFDAVIFNLSLLTTDVWGLVIGFFIFDEVVHALKFLGFFAIVIGVVLYNLEAPLRLNDLATVGIEETPSNGEVLLSNIDDAEAQERHDDSAERITAQQSQGRSGPMPPGVISSSNTVTQI